LRRVDLPSPLKLERPNADLARDRSCIDYCHG
jgi:hypothetical protein